MLDQDVLRFLRTTIGSLWALEQLLVMQRDPERGWTVDAMARELRSSPVIVTRILAQFGRAGLVRETGGVFRYQPRASDAAALVARVAADYATYPVAVTRALLVASDQEMQSFANAFRVDQTDGKE